MTLWTPYRPNRSLPELVAERTAVLDQLLRLLAGADQRHILIHGLPGSGRRTIAQHLLDLAPQLRRSRRLTVNTGALATQLYELAAVDELFLDIGRLRTESRGAVLYVDDLEPLVQGLERHELRRLTRLLRELLEPNDLRCIIVGRSQEALSLLAQAPGLDRLVAPVKLAPLSRQATIHLVQAEASHDWIPKLVETAERFFPAEGLPGSALRLLDQARELATQQRQPIDLDHIWSVIAERRGIPKASLVSSDLERLRTLPEVLRQSVIGQDHALGTVSSVITRALAGFRTPTRPIASFLFLGPSGVGKTELAKTLAAHLFRDPQAFTRIDMSEFSESHTVQRLIGAPPGYVGYEEGGQLTNPVAAEPYSLVLLDELEKAHPKVFDVFLQLLDDGRLTDGKGRTVDFSQTIVVGTSNVGLHEIVRAAERGELAEPEAFLRRELLPLLVEQFRPEFLNRFDAIIVFGPLTVDHLVTLGQRAVERIRQQLAARELSLEVSSDFLERLACEAYQPTFGARPMQRLVQQRIEGVIAQGLVEGRYSPAQTIAFDAPATAPEKTLGISSATHPQLR